MKINKISVFFPAYNEEANIENTINKTKKVLEEQNMIYEMIVVDDGSTDKTAEIVNRLADKDDRLRLVQHKENMGYGHAIRTGFKECKYEWICFTDSDGQFDFAEFPNFIEKQRDTQADLVIGYYKKRKVPFKRKLSSKIWEFIVWILFGLWVKDIDCGFKLLRKSVIDNMNLTAGRGAFISSEFLIKAKQKKAKMVQIPVTHYERTAGQATGADIKVILNSFKDLYQIKKKFLLFCFVGFTSALISLLIFNVLLKFNLSFNQSIIIGTLASAIYNFFMNRSMTFNADNVKIKNQIGKYVVIYILAQGIHILGGMFIKRLIGGGTFESNLAVIAGIALSIPVSFIGSLLWTFKKKEEDDKFLEIVKSGTKTKNK